MANNVREITYSYTSNVEMNGAGRVEICEIYQTATDELASETQERELQYILYLKGKYTFDESSLFLTPFFEKSEALSSPARYIAKKRNFFKGEQYVQKSKIYENIGNGTGACGFCQIQAICKTALFKLLNP